MLDVLRASKGGIITWIFLAAIILMFVISFGPGSFTRHGNAGCGAPPSYAAKVNGTTVPLVAYERQLQQLKAYYSARQGDEFVRAVMPQLGAQAMESVVGRALLIEEAERRGLMVGRDELSRVITSSPQFQENGKFSKDLYNETAQAQYGSTRQYEEMLRGELLLQRLDTAFEGTVQVPETEVHDLWTRYSDRVDLTFVAFSAAAARADVSVGDADVQAFAAKEGARIEAFYKQNAARYDQPEKVRARHILARVEGKDDGPARKKIEGAIARLKKGEDFAKVAGEVSEDENTKSSGGDLGVIGAGQAEEEFTKAALALKAGQLSEPVRTPAGWHVIKVDEVIPAKKIPLDQARGDIARELLVADRAAELVKQKATAALDAARSGKSLTDLYPEPQQAQPAADGKPAVPERKAALSLGGQPVFARDTGPFPASASFLPGLGGAADLIKDAVAAQGPGLLPRVYDSPAGAVVAVVKERKRPDESAFPKEKELFESQLREQRAQQLRQAWVADLRARAKVLENTALLAQLEPQRQD